MLFHTLFEDIVLLFRWTSSFWGSGKGQFEVVPIATDGEIDGFSDIETYLTQHIFDIADFFTVDIQDHIAPITMQNTKK
jgi:hypothetical protein